MKTQQLGSMNENQYRDVQGYRSSQLKEGLRSMAHLKRAIENPPEEKSTDSMEFGTFFHTMLLEGTEKMMERNFFPAEDKLDGRLKEGKAQKERITLLAADKPVIWPVDYAVGEAMLDAAHATPFWKIIEGFTPCVELALLGQVGNTAVKAKLDLFDPATCTIVDLKTTRDGSFRAFKRDNRKMGYWLQAAIQCELVQQLTGHWPAYYWAVAEKFPPYNFTVYELDTPSMECAVRKLKKLIERMEACALTGIWPGYAPDSGIIKYQFEPFEMDETNTENDYVPEE